MRVSIRVLMHQGQHSLGRLFRGSELLHTLKLCLACCYVTPRATPFAQTHPLLGAMTRHRAKAGALTAAVDHFLKVSRSYWPGLFHCYSIPALPRTNNDLEQFFGAHRCHERRTTGRKGATPGLVLRGAVRLVAWAATRLRPFASEDLVPETVSAWQELRHALETRRHQRTQRRRFRHDPTSYLATLEADLLKLILPP